jgi:hypothetical protein
VDEDLSARVYPEIDQAISFYGFQLDDLAVMLILFVFTSSVVGQAHPHAGRSDLTLPISIGMAGVLFAVWRSVKANRPRHFLEDLIGLLGEPDAWEVTPDVWVRPAYVIEPDGSHSVSPMDSASSLPEPWHPLPSGAWGDGP